MTEVFESQPGPSTLGSAMLSRLWASDADAWRQLVALFGLGVYQCCRKWGLQPSDAADVHQKVFRKDLNMTADAVRHAKARVQKRLREEMEGLV